MKIGDKVVCINDEIECRHKELNNGCVYTITNIVINNDNDKYYDWVNLENLNFSWKSSRFISIIEYRRNKILNIKNRICQC